MFAAGLMVCAACGNDERRGPASQPAVDNSAATADSVAAAADTGALTADTTAGCPMWGRWRECSVSKRLERAGLVFERSPDTLRHEFLSVPGILYETSRTKMQVFLYPSATERARDTEQLDSVTVSPRGQRVIWPEPATLVTSANLAAIILGLNEREVERAALALGAGLPPNPPPATSR